MELSWSTFVLEIINFLVLVWILKRFLYKPVLDVIARRRAGIEKSLADAESLNTDAESLKQQYEERLADWDQERQNARDTLARELETERATKLTEIQTTLEQEREKTRVAEARRRSDARRKMEETALLHGARFATRLLEQAAVPETEARLIELVIGELTQLPAERVDALRNSNRVPSEAAEVVSAFPLSEPQRQGLTTALTTIVGAELPVRFEQNGELMAGVQITIGAWVLAANLRDELKGFMELAHGE